MKEEHFNPEHVTPREKVIGLSTQIGFSFIPINEIIFCRAEGNYCEVYMYPGNKKELATKTLTEFEELLAIHDFFCIHRSYLINLRRIKAYHRTKIGDEDSANGGWVILDNKIKLPVSRQKRKPLLSLFAHPF